MLLGAAMATTCMLAWRQHQSVLPRAEPLQGRDQRVGTGSLAAPVNDASPAEPDPGKPEGNAGVQPEEAVDTPSLTAPPAPDAERHRNRDRGDANVLSFAAVKEQERADEFSSASRREQGGMPPPGVAVQSRWQDVWKPFYSEESARGFARGLERVSGVELQVRKLGAGRYQVAFVHDTEAEREQLLQRLSRASGLDLQGGGS